MVAFVFSVAIVGLSTIPGPHAGPLAASSVRAASPGASAASGDTRSTGEGPGLVGAPLLAVLGVLGLGLATAFVTLLYVRLTGRPTDGSGPPRR